MPHRCLKRRARPAKQLGGAPDALRRCRAHVEAQLQHSGTHQPCEPALQLGRFAYRIAGAFAGKPAGELPSADAHQDGVVVAFVAVEGAHDLGQLIEQHVAEGDAVVAHDVREPVNLDDGELPRVRACACRRNGVHAGLEAVCRCRGVERLLARGFDLATLPAVDVVDDAHHAVLPVVGVLNAR